MADLYKTPLDVKQNFLYELWKQSNNVPDNNTYDMQGYYKDIASKGGNETGMKEDGIHYPDTYKTPRHPSFSEESKYYNPAMGKRKWKDQGNNDWALMGENDVPITTESAQFFLQKLLGGH